MFKEDKYLWYAVTTTLVVRLLFVLAVLLFPVNLDYHASDSREYIALTEELLASGRFFRTGVPVGVPGIDVPEIVRSPGYPLFLIPGVLLNNVQAVTGLIQIILCGLTVLLVYRVALNIFLRREIALAASLLVALDPMSIFFSIHVLTETLSTFLIAAFVYCVLGYRGNNVFRSLFLAAVVLAASIFVRPISYYLPPLLFLIFVIIRYEEIARKKLIFLYAAVFLVVSMGPALLWELRNKTVAGYAGFSAVQDVNLYFFNAAGLSALQKKRPYMDLQMEMGLLDLEKYFNYHPEQRTWDASQRFHYMRQEGLRIIRDDAWAYAILHAKGMLRVLLDPGIVKFFKLFKSDSEQGQYLGTFVDRGIVQTVWFLYKEKPVMFMSYVIFGAVQLLICFFMMTALFPRYISYKAPIIVLLSIGFYYLILSGGPGDSPRLRLSILPVQAVLSAYGFFIWWDKIRTSIPVFVRKINK
jgi:4-amino-4-deoxy-L-arabinose transferase-like glycosyltransferase